MRRGDGGGRSSRASCVTSLTSPSRGSSSRTSPRCSPTGRPSGRSSTTSPAATAGQVDVLVGIEARGFILAAAVAYELGLGMVPGAQGRQAAGRDAQGVLRARVRHRRDRGAHRRLRARVSACSSSTTCWPPAAPPRRARSSSSGPAPRSPAIEVVLELGFLDGRSRLAGHVVNADPDGVRLHTAPRLSS